MEQRGQLPQRRPPGPQGRLHHRQPALQRQRLERRTAADRWPLAIRHTPRRQCQLRLDSALPLPPRRLWRMRWLRAIQRLADHQERRRIRDTKGAHRQRPAGMCGEPADEAVPQYADSRLFVVFAAGKGGAERRSAVRGCPQHGPPREPPQPGLE